MNTKIKRLYKPTKDFIFEPEVWIDNTPKEKKKALEIFEQSWKKVKTLNDLRDLLEDYNYDADAAYEQILEAAV